MIDRASPPAARFDAAGSAFHPARRQALAWAAGTLLPVPLAAQAASLRHEHRFLFGSPIELLIRHDPGSDIDTLLAPVLAGLQRINDRWNAWKPGDVVALNEAFRNGRAAHTSPALIALIRTAARLERASLGLFNAAIGGAVGAWGFHADLMRPGSPPDAAALQRWRHARPSMAQIEVRGGDLRSSNPLLQLDFGAIAKGAAADWALDRLRAAGIADAVVNLGGNLATMGCAGDRPWAIGVRDPFGDGRVASLPTGAREAVVTSGSYERFRLLDGERCTHILDPARAAPAGEVVSVTVVHRSATLADAAATALLVAGPRRWRRVAERMGATQVLLVARDGHGEVTAALAPRLQFTSAAWRRAVTVV